GENFGVLFAGLDRKMRKNGVGLFGSSQSITQTTFGVGNDAGVLRSGMCAANCFGLAYRANPALAPGYDNQPVQSLPLNRGYGYALMGERPQIRFQSFYTPDFQPWLRSYPRPTLDVRAQKRIGRNYAERFVKVQQSSEAKQSWLDALDASDDGATLPRLGTDRAQAGSTASASSGEEEPTDAGDVAVPTLLSPAQLRGQAAETHDEPATAAHTTTTNSADPTPAEQRVLNLLVEEPTHTRPARHTRWTCPCSPRGNTSAGSRRKDPPAGTSTGRTPPPSPPPESPGVLAAHPPVRGCVAGAVRL